MSATSRSGCSQTERVAEYALGALPANERSAFEAHAEACPECRAELAALRPVIDAFADWPTDVLRPTTPMWGRLAERLSLDAAGEPSMEREPAWKEVAPGISCKLLATDAATERVSMLVHLEPGISYPPHMHAGVEELHLLSGELWIDDRKLYPGDYNRAETGSSDARVWSETGCTCVLMTSFRDVLQTP